MHPFRAGPPESGFRFPKRANLYSHITTASEASMVRVSQSSSHVQSNSKVVKVLSENASKANTVYKSCTKSPQMPSLIAFDYWLINYVEAVSSRKWGSTCRSPFFTLRTARCVLFCHLLNLWWLICILYPCTYIFLRTREDAFPGYHQPSTLKCSLR